MLGEIFLLFANRLTADCKYHVQDSQFKWSHVKNEKHFLNFLFHLWNLPQILKIFKKRMNVMANVFPKLVTVKIFLTPLSKKHRFRTRFESRQVKGAQVLTKSP